jgi:hypothetical protein
MDKDACFQILIAHFFGSASVFFPRQKFSAVYEVCDIILDVLAYTALPAAAFGWVFRTNKLI